MNVPPDLNSTEALFGFILRAAEKNLLVVLQYYLTFVAADDRGLVDCMREVFKRHSNDAYHQPESRLVLIRHCMTRRTEQRVGLKMKIALLGCGTQ